MELDFAEIAKAARDPTVGKNAESIMGMLEKADTWVDKADKIVTFIERLEERPSVSALIRMFAEQQKISLEPLSSPSKSGAMATHRGIIPASEVHKQMYEELNKMPAEQLKKLIEAQQNGAPAAQPDSGPADHQ